MLAIESDLSSQDVQRILQGGESINPKELAGAKKVPLQLISPHADELEAQVLATGAAKYGPWNWRSQPIALTTYIGAFRRHVAALLRGEWLDPESGLPHAAHIRAGAGIVLDADSQGMLVRDTPPRGVPKLGHGAGLPPRAFFEDGDSFAPAPARAAMRGGDGDLQSPTCCRSTATTLPGS